jgi:23S rRNA pseudouridine1911/1915/1917 synthase
MPSEIWVKQRVHEKGVPCVTDFRVLKKWSKETPPQVGRQPSADTFEAAKDRRRAADPHSSRFSLIEAKPRTGRMHQIRVHLLQLGLPMVGDKIYGGDETCYLEFIETGWTTKLAAKLLLPRQALHSSRLEVADEYGKLAWEAPLSADLVDFMPR